MLNGERGEEEDGQKTSSDSSSKEEREEEASFVILFTLLSGLAQTLLDGLLICPLFCLASWSRRQYFSGKKYGLK